MLIFEKSQPTRYAVAQVPKLSDKEISLPSFLLRQDLPLLPELSELEVVRHYTQLSQKNYCVDTHFYPLGSCTMKYNPKGVGRLASLDAFTRVHPLADVSQNQGMLACLFELQEMLKSLTGMSAVSLAPMAGAQGEFAGILMIRAYHHANGEAHRIEMLVPKAAHGTNPASAALCGYVVKEIPHSIDGGVDIKALKDMIGPKTAGIMLTNPSTLGIFEQDIVEIAKLIHDVGGLLYYDGANLNAILGKVRPVDMGFDVMHMNMHKTFATPHGGGGPGSGPLAANSRLMAYLPVPMVTKCQTATKESYHWVWTKDRPDSIGRLSCFMGNILILLRAYFYIRLLGEDGLKRVAMFATLNANYLMAKLVKIGYQVAFPKRYATHEFIISLAKEKQKYAVSAMDIAKSLLDEGFYAPTIYFPLFISECLLIEPTETESKQMLDAFVDAMQRIWLEISQSPQKLRDSPSQLACKRLDEIKAARDLNLVWQP